VTGTRDAASSRMKLACLALLAACATEPTEPTENADVDEVFQAASVPAYDVPSQVALYCPGVVEEVTTYRGLSGTYRRYGVAAAGEPTKLVLTAAHDDPDAEGTFTGTRAPATAVTGNFLAIGDNPAIGAAIAFDYGADGTWDQALFVLGTRRSLGRVAALCLSGAEHPFLLTRSLF
jgi:hypothetical protein